MQPLWKIACHGRILSVRGECGDEFARMVHFCEDPRIMAVGERGLDYYRSARAAWITVFLTPKNREQLDRLLDLNVISRKGRRNKQDLERATAEAFVEARRQHSAIEPATGNLNHRRLDLVRTHGAAGFARTGALVMVAANVLRIGQWLKKQEERRWHQAERRRPARAPAWEQSLPFCDRGDRLPVSLPHRVGAYHRLSAFGTLGIRSWLAIPFPPPSRPRYLPRSSPSSRSSTKNRDFLASTNWLFTPMRNPFCCGMPNGQAILDPSLLPIHATMRCFWPCCCALICLLLGCDDMPQNRPNIVVILADDMGFSDISPFWR